jgi:Ca2+-binding RTX toxin-like protein
MIAGFGPDTLIGGAGDDVYLLRDGSETVVEAANGGKDTIILDAAHVPYRLPDDMENLQLGRAGYNPPEPERHVLYGNHLANTINLVARSDVWLDAGDGDDRVFAAVNGSDADGRLTTTIFGGEGHDSIVGSANSDRLFGGSGDDSLFGGLGGRDILDGGEGDDLLYTSNGENSLDGGAGDDVMRGGEGSDTYIVSEGDDRIVERGTAGSDVLDVTLWGLNGFTVVEERDSQGQITAIIYAPLVGTGSTVVVTKGGANPIEALRDAGVTWLVNGNAFFGGASDDHLIGTAGADDLRGQDGDDILKGEAGHDTLQGGRGDDRLTAGLGDDVLTGGRGADRFLVDAGTDSVTDLGFGRDALIVSAGATANATLAGSFRATALTSNEGVANLTNSGFRVNLAAATGPNGYGVSNAGSALSASLTGSAMADTLAGGSGADTLTGGPGDDFLTGGDGRDRFLVTMGIDTITDLGLGGAEVVTVASGASLDARLATAWTAGNGTYNNGSASVLAQGFGADVSAARGAQGWQISNEGNTRAVTLTGSRRNDTLIGGSSADTLSGGAGNDSLVGHTGNDSVTGGTGNDTLAGGLGVDRFVVDSGRDMVTDLGLGGFDLLFVSAGAEARATLAGNWQASASAANNGIVYLDTMGFVVNLSAAAGSGSWSVTNATATGATMTGSARGDTLIGGSGHDAIFGGGGADVLRGNAGDDSLTGGAGNDTLTGGAGVDRFFVDAGTETVTDLGLGADALIVSAGATANAVIAGSFLASALTSNAGVANLTTKGFAVNLAAATGPNGYSVTSAGSGVGVVLTGSAQSDTLTGGSGADTLIGGLGADNLTGGLGADVFRYTTTAEANADVILDFDAAQGDVLDLSRIDANGAAAGNGVFVFLGGGAFSGVAGQLRFAGGQVLGDVNGDGLADFAITLSGVAALSNTNILL